MCFLRMGCVCWGGRGGSGGGVVRQDGEYSAAWDFFCSTLLIHNLLEAVIGSTKAEEIQAEGPGKAVLERPDMLLIDRRPGLKSNTHFGCTVTHSRRLKYRYIKGIYRHLHSVRDVNLIQATPRSKTSYSGWPDPL